MAHEISHVVLRHGTAQASKASTYEVGSVAGQIAGAIIGGGWGQVVSGVSQFGFGTAFLRFSREYEKQADIEGTHIMAAAGYDPREMANVFRAIERRRIGRPSMAERPSQPRKPRRIHHGGSATAAGPEPGRRQPRLCPGPGALERSAEGADHRGSGQEFGAHGRQRADGARPTGQSMRPRRGFRPTTRATSSGRRAVELAGLSNNSTVTFAPDGAFGDGLFTHGIELGLARNESHDLQGATDELIRSLAQQNPNLTRPSGYPAHHHRRPPGPAHDDGEHERRRARADRGASTSLRNGNLFLRALPSRPTTSLAL